MSKVSDEILKAIEILIDKKLKSLSFDRTVDGKIIEKTTTGYLVAVEGDKIDIPVLGEGNYKKNDTVKVYIPQNNIKNAYIRTNTINQQTQIYELKNDLNSLSSYTYDEQLIGTWNGKKLYRRAFVVYNRVVGATSWATIAITEPNLQVINMYGHFEDSNSYPLNYGNYHSRYVIENGNVQFYNPGSGTYSPKMISIVIEYTKELEVR